MELLTLSLENFQGLKHEEIQLDGHSASIYGRNASGKTTIFNAITWLLFGKPSTWAKNWDPKTKGPNGDLHNLEHSATGTFRLDDGQTVILKKTFHEVWKRKRGSAAEEYSGNTIDYQINGVPCKEKEYTAAVQEYCGGEETMKLLTMPDYFPSVMDWQKRREILLDICGDVSDADVIDSTPELKELPEFLKMPGSATKLYKVDEYRKIAAAKKTDLNKKIEAIPNRIDEATRAIDKDLPAAEDLADKLTAAEAEEAKIAEEKRAILAGDTSEIRSSLANAKADYAAAKAAYIEEGSEARAEYRKAQEKAENELLEAKTEAANATADARRKKADLEHMKARRAEILDEYKAAAAETWDEHREICPTCGQALPEEKVEELRADFVLCRVVIFEVAKAAHNVAAIEGVRDLELIGRNRVAAVLRVRGKLVIAVNKLDRVRLGLVQRIFHGNVANAVIAGHQGHVVQVAVSAEANMSIAVDPQVQALMKLVDTKIKQHNSDSDAHAEIITEATSKALKELEASGEIMSEEQVKKLIRENGGGGGSGGGKQYEITLAADGWQLVPEEDGEKPYQYIYDAELPDSTSKLFACGAASVDSFLVTSRAGVLPGCETYDGFVRFFAQRIPEADIPATLVLFGNGGDSNDSGEVSIGQGLKRDASGAIAVNIGECLDFDSANALTVRKETVMTSEDLLDEEETQQEIVDMLK